MATSEGPIGFRGPSDSESSISGGAETFLGSGEIRPFSPGFDPNADPGVGLWVDPNAVSTEADSPFGLDGECEGVVPNPDMNGGTGEFDLIEDWTYVAPVGPSGPISLDDLTDVDTTTDPPDDDDLLTFDSTLSRWVPKAPTAGSGGGAVPGIRLLPASIGTPGQVATVPNPAGPAIWADAGSALNIDGGNAASVYEED